MAGELLWGEVTMECATERNFVGPDLRKGYRVKRSQTRICIAAACHKIAVSYSDYYKTSTVAFH